MTNPSHIVPWSTTIVLIIGFQLIIVGMLAINLFALGAGSTITIAQLPPASFIYTAAGIQWIGAGRVISHGMIAIANLMLMSIVIRYGLPFQHKAAKYIAFALGTQFGMSALTNIALSGLITVGGWWHVITLATTAGLALAATITIVIVAVLTGVQQSRNESVV